MGLRLVESGGCRWRDQEIFRFSLVRGGDGIWEEVTEGTVRFIFGFRNVLGCPGHTGPGPMEKLKNQ